MVRFMFEKEAFDRIMKIKSDYHELQKDYILLLSEHNILLEQQTKLNREHLEFKLCVVNYILDENPDLICIYNGQYKVVLKEPFKEYLNGSSYLRYHDFKSCNVLERILNRTLNTMRMYINNEHLYKVIMKINEKV